MPSERLRPVWLGAAAAVAVATAVALVIVLTGDPGERDARTVATLVAALLCGGAALAALELIERPGLVPLGAVVLAAAAVDFVLILLGIWKADFEDSDWWKLLPIGFAWVTAMIVVASTALWAGRLRPAAVFVIGALAGVWAAVATAMVLSETDSDGWLKVLGVLAVLTVGGFLVVPLLRRLPAASHPA